MTPPPAVAARTSRTQAAAQPVQAPRHQPALEVVEPRDGRRRARRRRALPILSVALVSFSLLSVVVGHALLAQDQVRLAAIQSDLTQAQTTQRTEVVAVGQLDNPTRITSEAITQLHMSPVTELVQLPWVSLQTPLATPTVAAPPPPPSPPPTTTATTTAETTSTTTSGTAGTPGATNSSTSTGSTTTSASSATSTGQ